MNSFIKKEDFDKEFSVVRNEFESGENNPFNVRFNRPWRRLSLVHQLWTAGNRKQSRYRERAHRQTAGVL